MAADRRGGLVASNKPTVPTVPTAPAGRGTASTNRVGAGRNRPTTAGKENYTRLSKA